MWKSKDEVIYDECRTFKDITYIYHLHELKWEVCWYFSGISNVLRSIHFAPGEAILYNNLTYGAMKNAVQCLLDRSPGEHLDYVYLYAA